MRGLTYDSVFGLLFFSISVMILSKPHLSFFLSSCICANKSVLPLDKTYLVRFHSYQKEKLMANQKINRDVLFTLPVLNDTHFNGNSKFNKHLKIHLELLVSCDDKAFC